MKIYEIEDMAIKEIQKRRMREICDYRLKMREGGFARIVEGLYFQEKGGPMTSREAEEFFENLRDSEGVTR